MTTYEVVERFVPLHGDRADDARADLARVRAEYDGDPHVRVAGMVETRSLAHRTPRTTAKWCAVIREAKPKTETVPGAGNEQAAE